jgi:hypothetical protein
MAIVNLGNDKLNINTTTAKGLEKVIGVIAKFVISAQTQTNAILYGRGGDNPKSKGLQKVFQAGVVNVVEDIADVDFCNLLNYLANQGRLGASSFNPSGPDENASPFEKKKWRVQSYAFQIQQKIDQYYSFYGAGTGQDSRTGLLELLNSINLAMESLLSPQIGLNDPEILKQFPEMSTATNYLSNALSRFNGYTNIGDIPVDQIQNVTNFIDKVRIILGSILSLSSPASLIASTNIIARGKIQEDFAEINKYVTPGPRVVVLLKSIIEQANKVNTIAKKILGYVNLARTIIKICLLLVKVFNIIKAFILTLPIPNLLTTVGLTAGIGKTYQQVLEEQGTKKLITRLNQINLVLNLIAIFVTSLIAALTSIIQSLTAILLNIKSCDPNIADQLQNTINQLTTTRSDLQAFLDDYNNNRNKLDTTFGGYTIEIVTEEVADEGISLRRRFGIARGANNIIAVQSTPTFASLDLIIINEVKVLLVSKGLVNVGLSGLNTQDAQVILESLNYLADPDITLNNIELTPSETAILLESEETSEIGTFVNNLPGGKALRNKIRKKLIANNEKLIFNLKNSDPNSTYSKNIVKEKETENTKLKIQKLEDERSSLQKSLLLSAANPLGAAAIIAKIKAIDNEIKALKNSLK